MKMKIRRLPYFLAFFVTGFSLLLGLSLTNITKDIKPVTAETSADAYYLVGVDNNWNVREEYELKQIGDSNKYSWTGEIPGATDFKIHRQNGNLWVGYYNIIESKRGDFGGSDNIYFDIASYVTVIYDETNNEIDIELARIQESIKTGVDKELMRIWLDRGFYEQSEACNMLQFGEDGEVNNYSTIYEPSGWAQFLHEKFWLAYFDIPITELISGMVVRVARVSEHRGRIWNTSQFYTWQEGDNNKVLYVGNVGDGEDWNNASLSSGIIDDEIQIPVTFTKYVLEGYLTCSDSEINGYGAFPEMNRTFFKDADDEWKIVGVSDEVAELGDIIIDDYADKDLAYTGGRVNTVTGWDKYTRMEMMYQASINGSSTFTQLELFTNKQSVTMVLVISLIGLTSLFGLHFLKKRKTI